MRRLPFRILVAVGVGLLPGILTWHPAQAQVDSREGIALQNQIYQLRQEVQQLRDQLARGGGGGASYAAPQPTYRPPPSGDIVTQLLTRVDALDERMRELRGRLDQTQHDQQQQAADLGKRIDDLAFQTNAQTGSGPAALSRPAPLIAPSAGPNVPPPGAPPSPSNTPTPPSPGPTRRTPEMSLQEGNAALQRRDYAAAEAAAREVLTNARTSPRAYDAQFLLAQALAGQRNFAQSAIAYDDAYNRNRKGSHAQDSLVGLSSTLASLNEKKAACDTLVKLGAEFPQVRSDLRDDIAGVRQRAGCR